MLPKDLFTKGFSKNGEPIKVGSLNDIRKYIKENFKKIKSFNKRFTSYGLKHAVETKLERKYITNGDLIASMILEGFKVKKIGNLNAHFNVSQRAFSKSLKKK